MLDGFDTEQARDSCFATKELLLLEADVAYQTNSTEACITAIDRLYRFFDGDLQIREILCGNYAKINGR